MKPYTLLPIAEQELLDSARFYDQATPGTGDRFIDDFLKLMERLGRQA